MKDKGHHMAKLLRKYSNETETDDPASDKEFQKDKSKSQVKKQEKIKKKKKHEAHIPMPETPDEMNKEMKNRTPIIRKRSHPSKTKE